MTRKNDAIDILLNQVENLRDGVVKLLVQRQVKEEIILDVIELFYEYFEIE